MFIVRITNKNGDHEDLSIGFARVSLLFYFSLSLCVLFWNHEGMRHNPCNSNQKLQVLLLFFCEKFKQKKVRNF